MKALEVTAPRDLEAHKAKARQGRMKVTKKRTEIQRDKEEENPFDVVQGLVRKRRKKMTL